MLRQVYGNASITPRKMEALEQFRHGKAVSQISTFMGVARATVEVYILDSLLVADSSSDYQRLYNEFNLKREDYDLVVHALDRLLKHKIKMTLSEIKIMCVTVKCSRICVI